jgi:glycine oxidase
VSTERHPAAGTDVIVIGGGIIGLSCAWRLAARGRSVTVIDPTPGRGASWAAAGMLAPVTEAAYGEQRLLRLGIAAAERWPSYAAELAADSGADPGLRDEGTLVVAHDSGDRAEIDRYADFAERLGLPIQRLDAKACREREPMLAPDVRGGLLAQDRSAHNRATVGALLRACANRGVRVLERAAAGLEVRGGHAVGVRVGADDPRGEEQLLSAPQVVLAAGAWSPLLPGLPEAVRPPVRPVRGTVLRLATPPAYRDQVLRGSVRATVAGGHVYLVPRADGEIVVGATSEEAGFDDRPTAGGVWELLRDARLVLPVVSELGFTEAWSGLRPVSPDNAPIVGASALPGLTLATGHGRNGVLLAPITADAVAAAVVDGAVTGALEPFSPLRFAPAEVSA